MYKFIFILFLLLVGIKGYNQTYNPANFTTSNKPYGSAQNFPTDARTYFYDATFFTWRPFQNTSEVLTYLNLAKYRTGQFDIVINTGGSLSSGVITGGTNAVWYFKNGTTNGDLVLKSDVQSVNGRTGSVTILNSDSLKSLPVDTSAAPRNNYLLTFDSTLHKWKLTAPASGYTSGTGISIATNIISALNTTAIWNANQLRSRSISTSTPAVGQVYKWDGTAWSPANDNSALDTAYLSNDTLLLVANTDTLRVAIPTIYTADGTLTGDRTVDLGNNNLTIGNNSGTGNIHLNGGNGTAVGTITLAGDGTDIGYNTGAALKAIQFYEPATGIGVVDDVDNFGMLYANNYSSLGLLNDRWIPDIAAVRKTVHDSITAHPGATNSNIGAGYRWAVPNTNNIKTSFAGYGILNDSSSNSNAITQKADTATLFSALRATIVTTIPNLQQVTNAGDSTERGIIRNIHYINQPVFPGSSLPATYTAVGSPSYTISGGSINFTGVGDQTYAKYIRSNLGVLNECNTIEATMTMGFTPSATQQGLAIGFESYNANGYNESIRAGLMTTTGSNYGKPFINSGSVVANTVYGSMSNTNINNGDVIKISLTHDGWFFRLIITNYTQVWQLRQDIEITNTTTPIVEHNSAYPAIYNLGGAVGVDSFFYTIHAPLQTDIMIVGNSITVGQNASNQYNRFVQLIGKSANNIYSGGGADVSQSVVNRIDEIVAIHPKRVFLYDVAGNDLLFGTSTGTWQGNLVSIRDTLVRAGIEVIWSNGQPRTGTDETAQKTFIEEYAGFKGDLIIDTWTPMLGTGTTLNPLYTVDGTHPNNLGMRILANAINASLGYVATQWADSANNIYYNTGSVGIGTSVPTTILQINTANSIINSVSGGVGIYTTDAQAANMGGKLLLGGVATGFPNGGYPFGIIKGTSENGTSSDYSGHLSFSTTTSGGTATDRMDIDASGNVGIGIATPAHLFHVQSTTGAYTMVESIQGSSGNFATMAFKNTSGQVFFGINDAAGTSLISGGGGLANSGVVSVVSNNPFQIGTNNIARLNVLGSGEVGIGTTSPGTTLDVNGQVTIRTINNGTLGTDSLIVTNNGLLKKVSASTLGSGITALTGDVTAAGPGSSASTLATVNSNVGSFTNANITVNAKGLITAAANGSGGGGSMAIAAPITSATAGSVLYAGTGGILQQSNSNFFYDSTNVRMGIGTNSPGSKLDIFGTTGLTATVPVTTFVTVGSNGYAVEYKGNNAAGTGLLLTNTSSSGSPLFTLYNSATAKEWTTLQDVNANGNGYTIAEGDQNGTARLTVAIGGNIGIGNRTPTARLHLPAGTATASTAPLKFTNGTPTTTPEVGSMQFSNGLYIIDSSNSVRDTIATRSWVRNNPIAFPSIVSSADHTGQTGVDTIVNYTVGAANGTFQINAYTNVTAISIDMLSVSVIFTDENNAGKSLQLFPMGATTANLTSTGFTGYPSMCIKAKSGTKIYVVTGLVTGGSISYDFGGALMQLK